jgi:leucyl-tRNA synthetase
LNFDEPFKKLINQGKITGDSRFVYRLYKTGINNDSLDISVYPDIFISDKIDEKIAVETIQKIESELNKKFKKSDEKGTIHYGAAQPLHVDIARVNGLELDINEFRKWKPDFATAEFIFEDGSSTVFGQTGKYICGSAIEKMSKAYYNVVNPDSIIETYGADTLRLYEMFLGPLEASKPWSTSGIDGVYKFLRRFWNLFHDGQGNWNVSEAEPTKEELKALHKVIKKVEYDVEHYSFNTSVSEFMICANELSSLKCNKRAILEPLTIVLASYAPHITEELWEKLGHADSILNARYPAFDESYLKENDFEYPISINGKVRVKMNFALDMPVSDIEKIVMASEAVQKWTEGKAPKKVIIVPGRIVNIVL